MSIESIFYKTDRIVEKLQRCTTFVGEGSEKRISSRIKCAEVFAKKITRSRYITRFIRGLGEKDSTTTRAVTAAVKMNEARILKAIGDVYKDFGVREGVEQYYKSAQTAYFVAAEKFELFKDGSCKILEHTAARRGLECMTIIKTIDRDVASLR